MGIFFLWQAAPEWQEPLPQETQTPALGGSGVMAAGETDIWGLNARQVQNRYGQLTIYTLMESLFPEGRFENINP